jgi:hypothetical protein
MYESTTEPGKKFGSAFKGRKFDSYHAGPEKFSEGKSKESDQPEVSAEPEEHGEDKVNTSTPEKHEPSEAADEAEVTIPSSIVEQHGPASSVHITHDHDGGKHTLSSTHGGHQNQSVYSTAAEAYEAGGELANTDVKRREHPDQQGAQSEEDGFEMPDLA